MKIIILTDKELLNAYKKNLYARDSLLYILVDNVDYLELFSKNFIPLYIHSLSMVDTWIKYIKKHTTKQSVFLLVTKNVCIINHIKYNFTSLEKI